MAEEPPNWQTYEAPNGGAPEDPKPISLYPPGVTPRPVYHAPAGQRWGRQRAGRWAGGLLTAGVFVIGGAGFAIWNAVDTSTDDSSTISDDPLAQPDIVIPEIEVGAGTPGTVDLLTKAGIAELNAALREATGSTRVLEVAIVRNSAFVTVPDKNAPGGARIYQWDGTLTSLAESVSPRKPFDFTKVRGDVLARLCGDAAATCTVVVGRPLAGDRAWLTVVGSGGPKRTDLDGNPV